MKKTFIIGFIILVIVAIMLGILIPLVSKLALFDVFVSAAPTTKIMPKTNILLLGVDDAFGHRSDTIMVLCSDPENKKVSLISIPRDTLVVVPEKGLDKINHAFAYGGVELSRKTVEKFLGINIPYHIIINLSGIIEIIDNLGGIPIEVEDRMYYVDYASDLYINLQPGQQKLSGKQCMGYLRYRSDGGDLKRISRQQKFLDALGNELLKRENIAKSPQMVLSLLSYLHTNLSPKQTIGLSLGLRAAHENSHVSMATIPGFDMMIDGVYYWKPDVEATKNLVNQITNIDGFGGVNN